MVKGVEEPELSLSNDFISYTLSSGEINTLEFDILNTGNVELQYDMQYSNNLVYDENTIGLWYFNHVFNNIATDETLNNNGTVIGCELLKGKFGNALKFDGIKDYIIITDSPTQNVNSITLESWLNIEEGVENMPLTPVKYLGYGLLYGKDGGVRPHIWASGLKWYESTLTMPTDQWIYLAMTFDSDTGMLTWYLNGIKMEERFEGAYPIDKSTFDILIGRAWTETMSFFYKGMLDEIRISNITRSSSEILNNYQRAVTGSGEWVQLSNPVGIIEPKNVVTLNFTFDASSLNPGSYTRYLSLHSNDPNKPYVVIPINLEVKPSHHDISIDNIDISESPVAGEQIYINTSISNLGDNEEYEFNVDLIINNEIKNSTTIVKISPQETKYISFNWTPIYSDQYDVKVRVTPIEGEIIILNNMLQKPIFIAGFPNIQIKPTKITFYTEVNEISEKTFTISNLGTANLHFNLFDKNSFYVFWDDMENGQNDWTHSGRQDSWELGKPLFGPQNAYSGENCWGTDLDDYYKEFTNCSLISPIIDLRIIDKSNLLFAHWYSIDDSVDRGYVEVWDGIKWHIINNDGYSGYSNGWLTEIFNLDEFTGKNVRIRFRLEVGDIRLDKGWYIDDVRIISSNKLKDDWLFENPITGVIEPNKTQKILLRVNSSILDIGKYEDEITVKSNDPNNRIIEIPILLYVEGLDTIPPIANAGKDIISNEDEFVQLNALNSSDNLMISQYTWTFFDNENITLTGVSPLYNFTNPGTYDIKLVVIDSSGNTNEDHVKVRIKDTTNPIADAGENINAYVNNVIDLSAKKSTDNTEIISYEWILGNGVTKEGMEITHTYTKSGTYEIQLIIKDSEGNTGLDKIIATINPPEGHGTWLYLIAILFIFIILFFWLQNYVKSRVAP
jgi:hypothetical protein